MDVLLEARQNGNNLEIKKIKQEIGVYGKWEKSDWIAVAILNKLEKEKRVQAQPIKDKKRGKFWQLTDAEYNRRADTDE
ncbi:MAG: hypothetical protein OXI67_19910 [Candidatus Poribacteria bacterium]|nr:hypothetical protein [Candidatus Poribacteria bacterium]